MLKVLVFTPTWVREDGDLAVRQECLDSVMMQVFAGEFEYTIGTDNPYPIGQHRNVLHQYQKVQDAFLDGDWDALLTFEHDNVMTTTDTLQKMYDTPGDVVYAPYQLRHGAFCLNTWRYENNIGLGMPLNNYPDELAEYKRIGYGRICGCGMGCTLFRRNVLEKIRFRGGDGEQWAPDIPFAEDALRAGFVSVGRFDTPVDHWDGALRLETYKGVESAWVVAIETVNAIAAGKYMRLVAGQRYLLTPAEASDLASVGYVRTLNDEGEPESAMIAVEETAILKRPKSKRAR